MTNWHLYFRPLTYVKWRGECLYPILRSDTEKIIGYARTFKEANRVVRKGILG